MKDPDIYLEHILEAIQKIERYMGVATEEIFYGDTLLQDAVIRQLEVIGEASKQIPQSLRKEMSDVEWTSIVGLRNKLIHEYFGVDVQAVWLVVKEDLHFLKSEIKKALK